MMFETARLNIRSSVLSDASDIHEMLSDEQTMTFFVEGTYTMEQVEELLSKNETSQHHYSLELRDTGKVIGKITFHPWVMPRTYEIGWIMNKDFTNQGYMTEAVKPFFDYGFDTLKLHRIIATCQPDNIPSKRLCDRYLRLEGTHLKCIHVKDDIWWDELFFALIDTDYNKENNQ